jgi:predicted O-methyltransferase YrrM
VGSPFQLRSYLNYWLDSVDQHSLHSPFLFDFYVNVVRGQSIPNKVAEDLRQRLLNDHRTIVVEDLGTRSKMNNVRKISAIASSSLSDPKFSSLYSRIIRHYAHMNIVELGTSLGVNTVYLAEKKDTKVSTFEGAPAVAALAEITFEFSRAKNVRLIQGNINSTLPDFLQGLRKLDFVFIDANHTFEATVRYFEQCVGKAHEKTVIVIDDIHLSAAMEKAWKHAKLHPLVHTSCDLYRCGILFFDPSLNKQHVILQF